jgi:hypothetical protein
MLNNPETANDFNTEPELTEFLVLTEDWEVEYD